MLAPLPPSYAKLAEMIQQDAERQLPPAVADSEATPAAARASLIAAASLLSTDRKCWRAILERRFTLPRLAECHRPVLWVSRLQMWRQARRRRGLC